MRALALLLVLALGAPAFAAEGAEKPAVRTPEQIAALRKNVLEGFAHKKAAARVSAAQLLVAAWPDSAPILDEALASTTVEVRLEAVRLMERRELGDMRERLRKAIADKDPSVRRTAIRIARHVAQRGEFEGLENELVGPATKDHAWIVRQEALYTLESVGSTKCLRRVLECWNLEKDPEHRSTTRRVLVTLLGVDHGEDVDAWRKAVDAAVLRARTNPAGSR
jgi:HEAT repeat protein